MTRKPDMKLVDSLRGKLRKARLAVRGKTFSEVPELFKHIESIKTLIRHQLDPIY